MPFVLADLPDALFREVIECIVSALDAWPSNRLDVARPAMKDICAATCVNSLWRAEVEDACIRLCCIRLGRRCARNPFSVLVTVLGECSFVKTV